ncbi:MAG: ion transporter [Bacteroidetes bacterium]|jgi:voltage-gated potassium channel|nr:ion transporter [Bacteroidota bacterium]
MSKMSKSKPNPHLSWRENLHEIIFEADTPAGKAFDVVLLIAIILSVFIVMLESVTSIKIQYGQWLYGIEWIFTFLFTIEYILRIMIVKKPWNYIRSFYGIIDFLSILPTYLSLFLIGTQSLIVVRSIRLLRVFKILKMSGFVGEASMLSDALKASRKKIIVFLFTVFTSVIILGTLMYLIEGSENGFTSIPKSIYWAIVTLTTVGYGDIAPQTIAGQSLAAFIMILGYAIIAVPTGIVTSEISKQKNMRNTTRHCQNCSTYGHDQDAIYCKNCGVKL